MNSPSVLPIGELRSLLAPGAGDHRRFNRREQLHGGEDVPRRRRARLQLVQQFRGEDAMAQRRVFQRRLAFAAARHHLPRRAEAQFAQCIPRGQRRRGDGQRTGMRQQSAIAGVGDEQHMPRRAEIQHGPDVVHGQAGGQIGGRVFQVVQLHLGIHRDEEALVPAHFGGHRLPVPGEIDEQLVLRLHPLIIHHLGQRMANVLQRRLLIGEHGDICRREPIPVHQHLAQLAHVMHRILQLRHVLIGVDADEQRIRVARRHPRRNPRRDGGRPCANRGASAGSNSSKDREITRANIIASSIFNA